MSGHPRRVNKNAKGIMAENEIIALKNITKSFSGINALTDLDFSVRDKEIHCVCGENGAGKSTMIKILTGALQPDRGEIIIDDKIYRGLIPKEAHNLGIHAIYQENLLIPDMDVAENVFTGSEIIFGMPVIDYKKLYEETQKVMDFLGAPINIRQMAGELSVANQQYVKIAKALVQNPRVMIMDEPTTMFNITDANKLLSIVKEVRDKRGISIIYITHKLEEIKEIADRVTVLRDGLKISCREQTHGEIELPLITKDMIGRPVDLFYGREKVTPGEELLRVDGLKVTHDSPPINFNVHRGEVLGLAGMVGSGRTEIAESIYGITHKAAGKIFVDQEEVRINSPRDALEHGICLITEDRQRTGLLLDMQVTPNITLPSLKKIKGFFLNLGKEKTEAEKTTTQLNLKALNMDNDVRYFSGGNQQKIVIGKWLYKNADVFIFDEPTRGIDVNSKSEIYGIIVELLKRGKAVIMISSDMPELISMSDRVIVIKKGAAVAELTDQSICEEQIIAHTI